MVLELTADTFQKDVIDSAVPVLVDFWSPTCAPCRRIAPVIDEIAAEAGERFRVGKVNAWDQQALAARYRINAVPTILVFKGGAVIDRLVGYQPRRRLLEALQPALNGHVL
jgi:thioredoxin 1